MEITTVELAYKRRFKSVIDDTDSILANIATTLPEIAQVDHVDELSAGDATSKSNQTAALSLGLVRALQFLAQRYHSWRMLHEEDEVTKMSPEEYNEMAMQKNLAIAGSSIRTLDSNARQAVKAHLNKDKGPARLGPELIDKIIHDTSDIGLSWVFATLTQDLDILPPS
jgi:hypothetical protein